MESKRAAMYRKRYYFYIFVMARRREYEMATDVYFDLGNEKRPVVIVLFKMKTAERKHYRYIYGRGIGSET